MQRRKPGSLVERFDYLVVRDCRFADSIAAVDKAYQKKYTVDPSLPLLLTDQAHSTTSRLFPIADIGEEDWGSLGL